MLPQSKVKDKLHKANLRHMLYQVGLILVDKMTDTLQGDLWKALHLQSNQHVVVKVTNKSLHSQSIALKHDHKFDVFENILTESKILEYLSSDPNCSNSVIKHCGFFDSDAFYYLVMENAGVCLFDFIVKVHKFLQNGNVSQDEWLRMVRYLFNQMLDAVQYLHSKNVCHFDISLENFCVNNVDIELRDGKFTFCISESDDVRVKLIDFGLAQLFATGSNFMSKKHCGKTAYYSPEICHKLKYNAKKNDIWCLGICLFMMVFGTAPWKIATLETVNFMQVMRYKGDITNLVKSWKAFEGNYTCDAKLVDLFKCFFQFEDKRADLQTIREHSWLQY